MDASKRNKKSWVRAVSALHLGHRSIPPRLLLRAVAGTTCSTSRGTPAALSNASTDLSMTQFRYFKMHKRWVRSVSGPGRPSPPPPSVSETPLLRATVGATSSAFWGLSVTLQRNRLNFSVKYVNNKNSG